MKAIKLYMELTNQDSSIELKKKEIKLKEDAYNYSHNPFGLTQPTFLEDIEN